MKLTEDDFEISGCYGNQGTLDIVIRHYGINVKEAEALRQQILQDQKLRELVKKRIKKILSDKTTYDQYVCLNALQELQSLVEESEK